MESEEKLVPSELIMKETEESLERTQADLQTKDEESADEKIRKLLGRTST